MGIDLLGSLGRIVVFDALQDLENETGVGVGIYECLLGVGDLPEVATGASVCGSERAAC
jgi:hypothetical protein